MGQQGVVVMGLDPGFASFGWCTARVERVAGVQEPDPSFSFGPFTLAPNPATRIMPLAAGVIRTKRQGQKERVYAADDNLSRARAIYQDLVQALDRFQPRCICAEAMSFPRSASVAAKMALSWGLVAAEAFRRQIPILQVTPQRLKRQLTGRNDASKEEVEAELLGRLGDLSPIWLGLLKALPAGQHEHMNDALAACWACLDSEAIQLLCG